MGVVNLVILADAHRLKRLFVDNPLLNEVSKCSNHNLPMNLWNRVDVLRVLINNRELSMSQDVWKRHKFRVGSSEDSFDEPPDDNQALVYRKKIEPWLSAVFQSEHLSLLIGNGLTVAVANAGNIKSASMASMNIKCAHDTDIIRRAKEYAKQLGRTEPNIEDQIRANMNLVEGLRILKHEDLLNCETAIKQLLKDFLESILQTEAELFTVLADSNKSPGYLLQSFLMSFASRTASRGRLNLFTTNYDRLIEYGCDACGLRTIDRFVGTLFPRFRSGRLDIDFHYNPPGIRGEPRYLEGVIRFHKLHGSIDWMWKNKELIRIPLPFGIKIDSYPVYDDPLYSVMIYPNPAKDMETSEFPYSEIFRDFSAALCRPNSTLVTYGYGFGDGHINRIIEDMLTLPSSHLVIISYDDGNGRIPAFCESVGRPSQMSLLIGDHFGNLTNLAKYYLPKPAIDYITQRETEILKGRPQEPNNNAG